MIGKILRLFVEGMNDFYRNPKMFIPGIALWAFVLLYSSFSSRVGQVEQTVIGAYGFLVILIVLLLSVLAFIFSGMIGMAGGIVKKKKGDKFFFNSRKFWLRNLMIVSVIVVISFLIGRIAHYGAFFIGKLFGLAIGPAQFVFVLIYFLGLVGFLIFFNFSSFFLVFDKLDVTESMKKSFRFVKSNYLMTLVLSVAFFVAYYLIDKISGVAGEILEYVILLPFIVLVLSRFVLGK